MVLVQLTSLNCYMSTLCLVPYALLLIPACWNANERLMSSAFSLALDPPFGIQSHKTFDTVQPCHLLKPNWNLPLLTVVLPQLITPPCFCYSLCECVCCVGSVCECVCAVLGLGMGVGVGVGVCMCRSVSWMFKWFEFIVFPFFCFTQYFM